MFLMDEIAARGRPARVALIGAGKFGAMFLAQAPTTPGLEVAAIGDLRPDRARAVCREVGWSEDRITATRFVEGGEAAARLEGVEVVVEATGDPRAAVAHARAAFAAGRHVVMVSVEADALVGPALQAEAARAGVVCSMAYGDQPALTAELVEWARSCGFRVVAAGKGTKHLPAYHASTPETVWEHYGLSAEEAAAAGMNAKMFNSFLDGTKSAIEMAAIANACGLDAPEDGLAFPPCGTDGLAAAFAGAPGVVEVVSCLHGDGRPVASDLRWGVYVVLEAPTNYAAACFRQYGLTTDPSGRFAALWRPAHLIGLELAPSVFAAVLRGRPTGAAREWRADVAAVAKRDLAAGETLDGEGGFTVWGRLRPARRAVEEAALPIGLAQGVRLVRPVAAGATVRLSDVALEPADPLLALRRSLTPAG